jgi:anti-anti-sigma regulatory factor
VLKRAHRQADAAGAQLRVVASPPLRRVLELTGADQVLNMYATLAMAVATLPGSRGPRARAVT